MQPVFELNLGEGVFAGGSLPAALPYGAVRYRFVEGGIVESRKRAGSYGLRVVVEVVSPDTLGDMAVKGLRVEKFMNLPEGDDFSKESTKGKGNRARVADLKALLVSLGGDKKQINDANGKIRLDLTTYVGREGFLFNEPAIPGQKDDYPEVHWLDLENGAKAMQGQFTPRLKKVQGQTPTATTFGAPPTGQSLNGASIPSAAASFAPSTGGMAIPAAANPYAPSGGPAIPVAGGADPFNRIN